MGEKGPEVCPKCWHEDCTCGTTIEQRAAAENRRKVAEAARKASKGRRP